MRFVMVLAVAVAAQLTARFCRRSVAASRESERGTAVPRTFLPLPARVRRRAAIRDPFLSLVGSRNAVGDPTGRHPELRDAPDPIAPSKVRAHFIRSKKARGWGVVVAQGRKGSLQRASHVPQTLAVGL